MTRYVIGRLLGTLLLLVIVSIAVFWLLHIAPGDPASILAGPDASAQAVAAIREKLGLDQPWPVQYINWIGDVLSGDLGMSYETQRPVTELIGQRLGSTLQLTITATILMLLMGVVMGVLLATSRSRVVRQVVDFLATLSLGLPPFISGVILIFVFAVVFGVLPSGGDASLLTDAPDALRRLILPSIAIALPNAPVIARLLATEMQRSRDQEFVLTAIAKGASRRRITWRHVLPNSLTPAIIEVSIRIGTMLGGVVVAEAIFTRSGLGSLLIEAVQTRDYQLAQVLLLFGIAAAVLVQLVAELCIARIDPRIRLGAH